jgi:hypothetical protein
VNRDGRISLEWSAKRAKPSENRPFLGRYSRGRGSTPRIISLRGHLKPFLMWDNLTLAKAGNPIEGKSMRLPLIAPTDLTPELYENMRKGISRKFNAFKTERADGALMGPWNPWLHEPGIGKGIWDLTLAMTANATLVSIGIQIWL